MATGGAAHRMSARALDSSAGVWADIGSLGEVTERDNSQTQGIFPLPVYVRAILVLHGQNDMLLHTLFDSPPDMAIHSMRTTRRMTSRLSLAATSVSPGTYEYSRTAATQDIGNGRGPSPVASEACVRKRPRCSHAVKQPICDRQVREDARTKPQDYR